MRPKTLSTERTIYPMDYDKNNRKDLDAWKKYIHNELLNQIGPGNMFLVEITKFVTMAPRKQKERVPLTRKQNIDGDRWIYISMFVAAIILALVITHVENI